MTQVQGLIEHVETWPARSFAMAAAAIAATIVYVADAAPFFTDAGTCTVDIDGVSYTATPTSADDPDNDFLTLSPALAVAVAEGDPITLVPPAEVKWAWVSFPGDDSGDLMRARVPHELVGYRAMKDGPREQSLRETVVVETDPEPVVVSVIGQLTAIDVSRTPAYVENENGESVFYDADGFTARTNDLIMMVLKIAGSFEEVAGGDGFIYGAQVGTDDIHKYDGTTGDEITDGFPIVGTFGSLAADSGYLYAIDSAGDINKWNAADGVAVGGGFPVAASFAIYAALAADGGNVYAIDSSSDIKGYDSAGALLFTIAGTFSGLGAYGGYIYASDSAGDIHKYDGTTGVEDTSVFPLAGDFTNVAADGGNVYGRSLADAFIYGYDAATAAALPGFPIVNDVDDLSAGDGYILGQDSNDDIVKYSTGLTSEVSAQIVSGTGLGRFLRQEVYFTRATRTGGTIPSPTPTLVLFDAFSGSDKNGRFWTFQNGLFQIQVAGLYDIAAMGVIAANATGLRRFAIQVNGVTVLEDTRTAVASGTLATKAVLGDRFDLAVGDTVGLVLTQNSGGSLGIAGSTLSIERVGVLAA